MSLPCNSTGRDCETGEMQRGERGKKTVERYLGTTFGRQLDPCHCPLEGRLINFNYILDQYFVFLVGFIRHSHGLSLPQREYMVLSYYETLYERGPCQSRARRGFKWHWLYSYVLPKGSGPILEVLQYQANPWQRWSKPLTLRPSAKISLISQMSNGHRIRY